MDEYNNGNNDYNNGYNGYNGYNANNGYNPNNQYAQYAPPAKEPKKPGKKRGILAAAVSAASGAVVGALVVGLVFGGSLSGTVSQAYIDQAVSNALKSQNTTQLSSTDSGGTAGDTVYNEVNMVTTDYSDAIQQVVDKASASVVGIATNSGSGTGVIVSSDGLILTNEHVIAQEDTSLMFQYGFGQYGQQQQTDPTITVTLNDGSEYTASVLYSDDTMDLAVIKIDATGLTAATLGDSDSVKVGEVTVAIGNPLGLDQTVTSGIVSALDRSVPISNTQIAEDLIQTDAAINSGNSGGALLNADGEVIGINSYKLSDGEGIGFAIPINAAKPILNQIIQSGEFKQVQVGVSLIDKELLSYYSYNITLDKGLYVYQVDASADASAKGLKQGDVITAVDGTQVNTILEFKEQIYKHLPGDSVTLTVERDGSEMEMTITLGSAS